MESLRLKFYEGSLHWDCPNLTLRPYSLVTGRRKGGNEFLRGEAREEHEEGAHPPQRRLRRRHPLRAPHLSRRLAADCGQRPQR